MKALKPNTGDSLERKKRAVSVVEADTQIAFKSYINISDVDFIFADASSDPGNSTNTTTAGLNALANITTGPTLSK